MLKNIFKFLFALLSLSGLLFWGCQPKTDTIEIPILPTLEVAKDEAGQPIIISSWDASRHIAVLVEKYDAAYTPDFLKQDGQYAVVDHEWMMEFIDWWDKTKFLFGISYLEQGFDCDNFADFISIIADFTNKSIKAELFIGSISVYQKAGFGFVPAGGRHALNFFVSDKGIFVLEPQGSRSTIIELDKYPNKTTIYKIDL
jgi:hypothetical protein